MSKASFDVQYRFFVVGKRPQCIWDTDISKRTLNFLESIDPHFFEYIADAHLSAALDDKSQSAAMMIRATYSQALETLFAFLMAFMQAPLCVPAWMTRYRSSDLKTIVQAVTDFKPVLAGMQVEPLSWETLSRVVHTWLVLDDKEKEAQIKNGFGDVWSGFARDFLDETFTAEYNSIKHGLRVKPGGSYIAIGPQDQHGVPASEETMVLLGKSDFGSSFLIPEEFNDHSSKKNSLHIRFRRHYRNWDPEDLGWGLHLISVSIQNLVSALKILNGVPATEVQFQWPTDIETFDQPWSRRVKMGITTMSGFETVVPEDLIKKFTEDQILDGYKAGKSAGVLRHHFPDMTKSVNGEKSAKEGAN